MKNTPASILVIERHPMMREALCTAISDEPDMKVVEAENNGAGSTKPAFPGKWEAIAHSCKPDIILLALGNPGWEELNILKSLHRCFPQTPILVLIGNEMPGQDRSALEAGACEVLTKASSRKEIIDALHEMHIKSLLSHQTLSEREANGNTS